MEEKKTNKGLIWLIVILVVLVLGLVGYIVYDKIFTDTKENANNSTITNNNISNSEKETESSKVNESIVAKELYKLITNVNACKTGLEWDFGNNKQLNYKDMDNETKFAIVGNYLRNSNKMYELSKTNMAGYNYYEITKDDFKNAFNYLFGKNEINYIDEFMLDYYYFTKADNGNYEGYIDVLDCHGLENFDTFLYDFYSKDNNFELYVKYAYLPDLDGEEGPAYYYDSKDNKICEANYIEKHIDELETYKYTFKTENNHYIFDTIEKVEYKK